MIRVLVLGAAGMAGHVIYTVLKENNKYEVLGTINKKQFDEAKIKINVFDSKSLTQIINSLNPNFVINCIGILINGSKLNPANAIYINAYYPHMLAEICKENACKLIHISTDCVFSGIIGKYAENSIKDAIDEYGKTKGLGEIIDENNLTIRTSIIGPELQSNGEGLFNWFMRQTGVIYGYKSAKWSGVTTLTLANFILWVLEKNTTGLVHLTNNEEINKFSLLSLFAKIYNIPVDISDEKDYVVNKTFINTNQNISFKVPSYQNMLQAQKEFMTEHSEFYKHYKYS